MSTHEQVSIICSCGRRIPYGRFSDHIMEELAKEGVQVFSAPRPVPKPSQKKKSRKGATENDE